MGRRSEKSEKSEREKEFIREIKPHFDKLASMCRMLDIPFFLTVKVDETKYAHAAALPYELEKNLATDTITREVLVIKGFDVVKSDADAEVHPDEPDLSQ